MLSTNRLRALAAAAALTLGATLALTFCAGVAAAQGAVGTGADHADNILGVRLGMDVPTALEQVFVNAHRKPGQEKPDAMRKEGKDKQDIRVLYKGLEIGDLEIVFAGGQRVKEIMLLYTRRPTISDLNLAPTGSTEVMTDRGDVLDSHLNYGKHYDDRYSIGFTDTRKTEKFWWRDEATPDGYHVRVGFISGRLTQDGALAPKTIYRKLITVKPGDEAAFLKAVGGQ
ncbi:MAG TPA: hypothetical protein VF546_01885 [Pyrinomonadaceae bacterium]|jgi:hypothetical protein